MICSILETDLYKLSMMQAVLQLYPDTEVTYQFINRRPEGKFNRQKVDAINEAIGKMSYLSLSAKEYEYLKQIKFLYPAFLEYLSNYRFDPSEVKVGLENDELSLSIRGPWHRTIAWEVPLMALISEIYFNYTDTDVNMDGQETRIAAKGFLLSAAGCKFADFGTRRRRNSQTQDMVVRVLKDCPGFVGTSNVHLAMKYGVKPIGTMAHEWIQAHSVLAGMKHANRFALDAWQRVYKGNLGDALTDTFGTKVFFEDFGTDLSRLFDGVRHDSGDPISFINNVVAHYKSVGVDPTTKTIIFSDALTPESAVSIKQACDGKIKCAFGIGTNFSNDFPGSKPLNMVIKLTSVLGTPVVKLSDVSTKAVGEKDALRVARYVFFGTPLDEPLQK
jgi:nicotinate phosphoribosyltransferase